MVLDEERRQRLVAALGSLEDEGHFVLATEYCPRCWATILSEATGVPAASMEPKLAEFWRGSHA